MANFCTNCGTKLEKDASFCTNCGTKVDKIDIKPKGFFGKYNEMKKARKELNSIVGRIKLKDSFKNELKKMVWQQMMESV